MWPRSPHLIVDQRSLSFDCKGDLRSPPHSGSYIVFLLCCRLAPPPGRGSLRGAPFPPSLGLPLAPPSLPCGFPCGALLGRVGAAFGAPPCAPLGAPLGLGSAPVYLDWIEIWSTLLCLAQAILWRVLQRSSVDKVDYWFRCPNKTEQSSRPDRNFQHYHCQQLVERGSGAAC